MKYFNSDDIKFLTRISENLNNAKDKVHMRKIINKVTAYENKYVTNKNSARTHIADVRKYDKFYARDQKTIQNHFSAMARSIVKSIEAKDLVRAKKLYEVMKSEAKLPKYEKQFNTAIEDYLAEHLQYLEK